MMHHVDVLVSVAAICDLGHRKRDAATVAAAQAFAGALRELRERQRFAQEALALEADVNRTYISGLERGLHNPTIATVYKLLPWLKVSFPEFARIIDKHYRRVH